MKIISNKEKPYVLDTDENDAVALTEKNVEFIKSIIRIDSSYRNSLDKEYEGSSAYIITKKFYKNTDFDFSDRDNVKELVKALDKENSTHLSVAEGIKNTTEKIFSMREGFKERLLCGDPDLVCEIAKATKGRNNFSFATKFCSFTCRHAFEGTSNQDNYCIYDNVIANILPYYAYIFLGKKYIERTKSNIEKTFKATGDYKGYRQLIDDIIEQSEKETGYKISRADFDSVIWYYYKGGNKKVSELLKIVKSGK